VAALLFLLYKSEDRREAFCERGFLGSRRRRRSAGRKGNHGEGTKPGEPAAHARILAEQVPEGSPRNAVQSHPLACRVVRRPAIAALAAAFLFVTPAAAQVADSDGGGLRLAAEARAALARAFVVPLRGPLESGFGYRWGRLHAGLDIGVLQTDRVRAALGGVVSRVGYQAHYEGYGNVVVIRHGSGLSTLYAHLASYRVRVGEELERAEPIGRAGCTGSCTGEHLHFEVRVRGKPVNPMRYVGEAIRALASPDS
jgi:murein DD-endopeptidase MepM/ murein hydrolase activator NlpD